MATLHLVCGLPCAGKTTLARQLEQEHRALRLTPDEWHIRLFGADFGADMDESVHNARHDLIESMLWEVAARVLALGVNVILDFGFWARSEREDYRARAALLGASSELHLLHLPDADLLARLATRNAQRPPNTFVIPEAKLKAWIAFFQVPTEDELERREC